MSGQIVDRGLGAAPERGSWHAGKGLEEADDIAARLADTEAARARVRQAVIAFDADDERPGAVMTSAVWVPDRTTGETHGALRVELLVGTPGVTTTAESFAADARKPARTRGYKVFHQDVATTEVDALAEVAEALARESILVVNTLAVTLGEAV